MNGNPMIERIQLTRYRFPFNDVGYDLSFAMGAFYDPGQKGVRSALGIRVHTDEGVTGEYVSIAPATFEQINMFAPFLIGKNALERERFYNQAKVILRKNDRMASARSTSPCGTWRASCTRHLSTGFSADIVNTCRPMPALTTRIVPQAAWTARRHTPILPSSASNWAIRDSRFIPGAKAQSRRKLRPCTPSGAA